MPRSDLFEGLKLDAGYAYLNTKLQDRFVAAGAADLLRAVLVPADRR